MADAHPSAPDPGSGTPPRRLLLGVCGSGNVLVLPQYLMTLRAGLDVDVRIVMTRSAAALVPASTMRLVCEEVYCDGQDELTTGHVSLAVWAERFVVLPATANMLGQAAHGLASGLLSSALLAHESPVLFFPSMNSRMWERPAVRRNVSQLRADGHVVVEPVPAPAWEIAGREMRTNHGLPPPATVTAVVSEFCRLPVGPRESPVA
ncbi:flavoprotein [Streptomyces sp. TRM49041]|uniref:flavoprotein n=1 Tax=Streptomyces sp. TRM49041 TaxID=2603216 RepID=UPI0011EDD291|nr:flavoprotein [Streptomyces sp. TRM49041]